MTITGSGTGTFKNSGLIFMYWINFSRRTMVMFISILPEMYPKFENCRLLWCGISSINWYDFKNCRFWPKSFNLVFLTAYVHALSRVIGPFLNGPRRNRFAGINRTFKMQFFSDLVGFFLRRWKDRNKIKTIGTTTNVTNININDFSMI